MNEEEEFNLEEFCQDREEKYINNLNGEKYWVYVKDYPLCPYDSKPCRSDGNCITEHISGNGMVVCIRFSINPDIVDNGDDDV